MTVVHEVQALVAQLGGADKLAIAFASEEGSGRAWRTVFGGSTAFFGSLAQLNASLPDRGLPSGVIELSAASALGGGTRVALAAVRSGQQRGERAWCASIDPEATLCAPGVVSAGISLDRLLVVRPLGRSSHGWP